MREGGVCVGWLGEEVERLPLGGALRALIGVAADLLATHDLRRERGRLALVRDAERLRGPMGDVLARWEELAVDALASTCCCYRADHMRVDPGEALRTMTAALDLVEVITGARRLVRAYLTYWSAAERGGGVAPLPEGQAVRLALGLVWVIAVINPGPSQAARWERVSAILGDP